uniref:Uncharacterized protein n=1 Tax=Hyaloperonospora arabidopsidis (strain Emoy2) TaxID=559515 RepID=M4BSQ8_HYAAE
MLSLPRNHQRESWRNWSVRSTGCNDRPWEQRGYSNQHRGSSRISLLSFALKQCQDDLCRQGDTRGDFK